MSTPETLENKALQSVITSQTMLNSSLIKLSKIVDIDTIRLEIGKTISLILKDIGIINYPDKYAQKRIIYYLLSYYKDFSLLEIRQAFELALSGKLQVNIEHYQSFDIRYLTRILNAYKEHKKAQILAKIPLEKPQISLSKPIQACSKPVNYAYLSRLASSLDKTQNIQNVYIVYDLAYNKLIEEGIILVSQEDWVKFLARAELQYLAKLKQSTSFEDKRILQNFEKVKYQYPFELTRIQRIAKKMAVLDFLHQLKSSKTSLSTLLTPLNPQDHEHPTNQNQ
jgi:hypothetical protein